MCGSEPSGSEPRPVEISTTLLAEIFVHAREVFPAECCGWLTGPQSHPRVEAVRRCANAQDDGEHPSAADRTAETAYVIAGDDLIALSRSIDSEAPAKVIYHSHPNGRAYFSETDRKVATSPWGDGPTYPVQQLVVGIDSKEVREAALFAWSDESGGFIEIARYDGATL